MLHTINNKMEREMISACKLLCSDSFDSNDDNTGDLQYSYIGIGLFLISEVLSYLNIEANGIVQLVASVFKKSVNRK